MNVALISPLEDLIVRLVALLLVGGAVGFLLARRWQSARWPGAATVVALVLAQARHFIPESVWPGETRTAVWQMLAMLVGAGVIALSLILVGARRSVD